MGVFKSKFTTDLSIFDNNFPQNGSNNEETAPRTRTGYPHEGPSVGCKAESSRASSAARVEEVAVQGYLAHKKHPPSLGPPQGPRHSPVVGSYEGAVSHERGTLVHHPRCFADSREQILIPPHEKANVEGGLILTRRGTKCTKYPIQGYLAHSKAPAPWTLQ